MDDLNRPLTFQTAISGPDHIAWKVTQSADLTRLIEATKTINGIASADKPRDRMASYYNPQVKVR